MSIKELKKEIEKNYPDVALEVKRDIGHQIGLALEEARIKKGLTQKQLAKMINTQQPSIARVENGAQIPSFSFLQKIAGALNTYLLPPKFAGINDNYNPTINYSSDQNSYTSTINMFPVVLEINNTSTLTENLKQI